MRSAKTVIKVESDNVDGYMTFEAYAELRLQMSTGDFHTHKHEVVKVPIETEVLELIELDDGTLEFDFVN